MTDTHSFTYPRIGLLIDGEWIYDRPTLSNVENPSTEAVLGTVPRASAADLTAALESSARGFEIWRKTPPAERSALIEPIISGRKFKAYELILGLTMVPGVALEGTLPALPRGSRLAVIAPRDSAKSTWLSFAWPLYCAVHGRERYTY